MKVMHFHDGNWYGGVEKVLLNLQAYRCYSPEIEQIFVLRHRAFLSDELKRRGATVELIPAEDPALPWTKFTTRLNLLEVLQKHECEVLVNHEIENHVLGWPVVQFYGAKNVLWIHSSDFRLRQPVYKKLNNRIPDLAICTSRHVQGEVNELWPELRTDQVYPPLARFQVEVEVKRVKQNKEVTFIYVGRMVEYKGLADIIEALGRIKDLRFHFIAVGGPEREREVNYFCENKRRAEELSIDKQVSFVGYQENIFDYLLAADVFVHPNKLPEPLGLVFIEALSAGLPVVATDIGGAREILQSQSRKMGDLTPPNDVEALAAIMRKYAEDNNYRLQITRNIQEGFINICDPEKSMKKLSGLLRAL